MGETRLARIKSGGASTRTKASVPTSYAELRRRVHETLLLGQQAVEEARVRTYWDTGWWIKEHLLLNRPRADYGEEVLRKLSRDEGVSESVFKRCRQFAEKFQDLFPKPIGAPRHQLALTPYPASKNGIKSTLSWSHYRSLLPIEDAKLRRRLAREAARRGWTVPELEARIQSLKQKSLPVPPNVSRSPLLEPKKGELFTYRIVEDGGVLALDHGFASYWNLSGQAARRFRKGDLVRKSPSGKLEKLKDATASRLYTYEAEVIRVVDGDSAPRNTAQEMRAGPSKPTCGSGLQSALSGMGQKPVS